MAILDHYFTPANRHDSNALAPLLWSMEDQQIIERLDEFYEMTGINLQNNTAGTLSGLITLAIGRIPRKNEKIKYKGIKFEIIDSSDRLIKKVKLLNKI